MFLGSSSGNRSSTFYLERVCVRVGRLVCDPVGSRPTEHAGRAGREASQITFNCPSFRLETESNVMQIEHFVDPKDKKHPKFPTVADIELVLFGRVSDAMGCVCPAEKSEGKIGSQ